MTNDIRDRMVEFLPRLRRFAYSLTRNMDQGDDLVQDTCARALSRLDQWVPGTSLESWMFRIAQNIWLDQIRAGKVRGELVDVTDADQVAGDDGRIVTETALTLSDVESGMRRLSPEAQVLIALVCVDGLSYREAADSLGLPIGTVMSRLARARRALHDMITGAEPAMIATVKGGARR